MKKVMLVAGLVAAMSASATGIGFLSGEREDGLRKICYYDTPSGTVAITIKIHQLCPLTIKD